MATHKSRLSHGIDENGVAWGVTEDQRNNGFLTRMMLASQHPRRIPFRPLRRLYFQLRDLPSLILSNDFRTSDVGPDLFLPHPHGIVIHAGAKIGAGCTIYHNVTIGETGSGPGVPVIGDGVLIGAGAIILGKVSVGDGATIAAGAIVVDDVPAGAVVVGARSRIIEQP